MAQRFVPDEYKDRVFTALLEDATSRIKFNITTYQYEHHMDGVMVTISELKRILKNHRELLFEFNGFLPEGFNIPQDADPVIPRYQRAVHVLNDVQEFLREDDNRYTYFMITLKMLADQISYMYTAEFVTRMEYVFGHRNLDRDLFIALNHLPLLRAGDPAAYNYYAAAI